MGVGGSFGVFGLIAPVHVVQAFRVLRLLMPPPTKAVFPVTDDEPFIVMWPRLEIPPPFWDAFPLTEDESFMVSAASKVHEPSVPVKLKMPPPLWAAVLWQARFLNPLLFRLLARLGYNLCPRWRQMHTEEFAGI